MGSVLVLGELLMRLTPQNKLRFSQSRCFDMYFGGAEANVAVSLASLGIDSKMISCVPNNDIGMMCKSYFESSGVDCSSVIAKDDSRLGIYYYEEECSARRGKVIYDRGSSAITKLTESDFNYDDIFNGVEILHISGITFGLGQDVIDISYKIVNEAKKRDIKISVDLNYRKSLFGNYAEFYKILLPVVKDAYLCFGWLTEGTEELEVLDGSSINEAKDIKNSLHSMIDLGVKYVATTIREGFATEKASLVGIIYDGNDFIVSTKYDFRMFSRIGGGDAFSAGVIKAIMDENCISSNCVEFGVANAILKHSIIGDSPISTNKEVMEFLNYKNMGSVSR